MASIGRRWGQRQRP